MDRTIVYPGEIPLAEDALNGQKFVQRGFSAVLSAVFGSSPIVDGFACVPTQPNSLAVLVGGGSIVSSVAADATVYGVLTSDSTTLVKQGDLLTTTTFPFTVPTSPGQSINYLIQVAFQEVDDTPVPLPYFNAAAPSVPWSGPGNSGAAQATARRQKAVLNLKAGASAATGSQTTPATDTGYAPLWIVTVAYGQTSVTSGNIALHPAAPFIPFKLQQLAPGFSRTQAFSSSGIWVVPNGVTRVKATVVGGGGAGGGTSATGSNTVSCAAGGNYGSVGIGTYAVTPGEVIAITVGAQGTWSSGTGGTNGGTSSFGTRLSAPGGHGAGANPPANPPPLTQAATPSTFTSVGGDINIPEKQGGFSIAQGLANFLSGTGASGPFGAGGAPGGGSSSINGSNAIGFGAGGSGGASGPSDPGKAGGYGTGGLVLVEY